jgi:hypothetical protein
MKKTKPPSDKGRIVEAALTLQIAILMWTLSTEGSEAFGPAGDHEVGPKPLLFVTSHWRCSESGARPY